MKTSIIKVVFYVLVTFLGKEKVLNFVAKYISLLADKEKGALENVSELRALVEKLHKNFKETVDKVEKGV